MQPDSPRSFRFAEIATGWPAVLALLLLLACLALSSARDKSHTFDEVAHLAAGYSYWALNDYRLNPENGNLPQRLAGLPAWLMGARAPDLAQAGWKTSNVWSYGDALLFRSGNDPLRLVFAGRAMTVAVAVLLGLLIYAASRQLFGRAGAILSLWLYVFSPTILAHSRLMTSDLVASALFLAATFSFWRLLQCLTLPRLATSALALAGLFLAKTSALLAIPILMLVALTQLLRRTDLPLRFRARSWIISSQGRQLATIALLGVIHGAVVVVAIWGSVGFRYSAFNEERAAAGRFLDPSVPIWQGEGTSGEIVEVLREHRLLPESYLYGFAFVMQHAKKRAAFLAGRWSTEGWWWYFPYAVLVKTPPGTLALVVATFFVLLLAHRRSRGGNGRPPSLSGASALALLLLVYWLVLLGANLNIGHRHSLPTYPPMFVLAGAIGAWVAQAERWKKVAVGLAALTVAAECLLVAPNYLAYFNLFVGGPNGGWKQLVDSSLDWGQDLPALKRWLDSSHHEEPVYLSYFGTSHPSFYGIEARRLPGHVDFDRTPTLEPIVAGTYCISATMLQSLYLGPAAGPWTKQSELAYRTLEGQLERAHRLEPAERGKIAFLYDRFRIARLAAFLRKRAPTTTVNHSIIVFRLDEGQARRAVNGPPPYDPPP